MRTIIAEFCVIGLTLSVSIEHSSANPTGGSVVGGDANATIAGQGTALTTINQSANQVIINWQNFSIGAGEITRFVQPSATAAALNRVTSGNPSQIYGSLQANGRVFVINPNGILVGPSGQIDTKGFVASTLDVPDASFLSGANLILSGNSTASVRNQGSIQALGGDVYLIAHSVENDGTINAPQGTVGLAAGSQVQLVQSGNEHLSVLAGNSTAPATAVGVNNSGTIQAASAELKAAGGNIYALAINNGGVVRATGIVNKGGHVYLAANGGNIQNSGTLAANNADGSGGTIVVDGGHNAVAPATVINSGTIEARGDAAGSKGGTVEILGDDVGLFDNAVVDVSGDSGGGTALIGGDLHGANSAIQNAQASFVSPTAEIYADALTSGSGGKVIVWADDSTRFYGSISAEGGSLGGNGGFVETSGKDFLEINGAQVDASAAAGNPGQWLMDPENVVITGSATAGGSFSGGNPDVFTPTADNANVAASDINAALDAGTDVQITTGATGSQNGDINVDAAITKSTGNNCALTLTADPATGSIFIDNDGSTTFGSIVNNSTHNLNVSLSAGQGVTIDGPINTGSGGTLNITAGGDITQNGGGILTVNQSASTFSYSGASVGNVLLGNAANNFGGQTVTINASGSGSVQDVAFRNTSGSAAFNHLNLPNGLRNLTVQFDNAAITIPVLTLSGNLTVTANGITDSGAVVVPGTTTLAAGAGNNITLNNSDDFGTVAINSGNNVTVDDINGIDLGASTVSGNLNVTANGPITQSGALTVNGGGATATFAAGAGNNITLNNGANDFTTVAIGSGNNVALADANAINLGASTVSGNLNVTAGGNITESGALIVNGAGAQASFTVTSAGSDVLLASQPNDFTAVTVSGPVRNLGIQNIDAAAAVPILPPGLNDLSLIFNNAAITLPALTLSGNLAVTAGGPITQSGALVVNGAGSTATFATGANDDITLLDPGNDFTTFAVSSGINVVGRNVWVQDANNLNLGNVNIQGDLTVYAPGVVTSTGTLNVGGQVTVNGINTKGLSQSIVALSVVNIPVPKLQTINIGGAQISLDEAAKLLPPGSIGTLWLQLPFPPSKKRDYKIEDISNWTSGHLAAAGNTTGPQTPR